MALDMAKFEAALKQYYPSWSIMKQVYKNRPFLALLPKNTTWVGDVMKVPLDYGNSQNRSNTFSVGLAGTSNTQTAAFLLSRKQNYGFATIGNEVMLASESDRGAFMRAVTREIDGAIDQLGRSLSIQAHRGGTGVVGKVSAVAPTTTLTLATTADVVNFEVGMMLAASTANGGGAVKPSVTVTKVDRVNGIITLSADVSGGGYLWAAADYLFPAGDYDKAILGFDSYVPYDDRAARLAASFNGVTRNVDETRLGGLVSNGTGKPIEEAIIDAAELAHREGAELDYCFMNPTDFGTLIKALGSKVQRVQVSAEIQEGGQMKAAIGFNAIEIYYGGGTFKVLADRDVVKGRAEMVNMSTWELASLGELVRLFDQDGLRMLRSPTSDALDLRVFSYSNLINKAPGQNLQLLLPA